MPKVGLVSLGCAKNLVDSEIILGMFNDAGYELVNAPEEADIIIVNTCGFIKASKEESIDTIFEMASYKKKLVVTGCLVQR
ncbi:MAG: 30S ribosomal protein S12 methylthiotransferase RimO, partial [Bacilli bacterium]|nr:30S ribosomal protein S12 methylthiotransferase RimO [Bacilli bacterium]